jgi:hypothetical protein
MGAQSAPSVCIISPGLLAPGPSSDHTLADLDRRLNDQLSPVVPIAGRLRITDGDAVHQQLPLC